MTRILMKILKVFLIFAAALVVLCLVFGAVLLLEWPWWVGFFVLLGMAGVWLGIVVIRKMLLRRREQNFVQQVIEQDDSYARGMGDRDKERSKELQDRWKEAIQALRSSHLKKLGNPLYVLPWYMIIGESASGKTTAIKSARLSSPFAELSRTSGISGTRNCDWWFFEQAILIDTAGRYAIPVDEGRDRDEWQKFLSLLIKFRKREPVNGLVVTVAADKLIDPRLEVLEDDGRNIRRRIDELMRVLGAKFPIYLLVTKCDLIQGMTQFCDNLPEKTLSQAMGFLNRNMSKDVVSFHERAVNTIGERLRDLRLLIFQKAGSRIDPELLLFPEEFERIKPGLDAFMKVAFQENPYQETPILRGIFYSSGRQEGSPYSHFLSSLGLLEESEVLPGTNRGLFLQDFFSKILPKDRRLFTPTQRTLEWGRLTRNLGLTSWMAIAIALCGLLSFSFVKNLNTLKVSAVDFTPPPILQGEIFADVVSMDRFKQAILNLEGENDSWWIPRFWLTESLEVEKRLKEKYCAQFRDGFLAAFDKQMSDSMSGFSSTTPDPVIGRHAAHLVRRINLLKARLEGKSLEALAGKPQPSFDTIVVSADARILPELREKFHGLYLYNLVWRDDTSRLNQEMNMLQSWLKLVLELHPDEMHWLAAWTDENPELSDILLQDFWGGSVPFAAQYAEVSGDGSGSDAKNGSPAESAGMPESPETEVSPAVAENPEGRREIAVRRSFTSAGKETIESFLGEMEEALPDRVVLAGRKTEFEKWYKEAYFREWYEFGESFPKGVRRLNGKTEWQQVASIIATEKSPYFALLDRMALELDPFQASFLGDKEIPPWVDLVFEFQAVLEEAGKKAGSGVGAFQDANIVKRATVQVQAKINRFQRETGLKQTPGGSQKLQSRMIAAKALEQYYKALQDITPVASSRKVAFQMTAAVFGEDPATGASPFFIAKSAAGNLKTAMAETPLEQTVFWELAEGPWRFLWEYSTREAACQIRTMWEENVLVEVQNISDIGSRVNLLLGSDGFATKFIQGPAEPFLSRNLKKGYYSKEVLDKKIQFEDDFLNFITKGSLAVQPIRAESIADKSSSSSSSSSSSPPPPPPPAFPSNFSVTIRGLPTDANVEAQIRPHATNLEVRCAAETLGMMNLNYPVQKTFNWSPSECGDVNFSIEVGNLVLSSKYTGEDAFPRFLREFSKGTRTFYAKDFPENQSALERLGVQYIRVNYQFSNHEPVLAFLAEKAKLKAKEKSQQRAQQRAQQSAPRIQVPKLPENIVQCWDR